MTRPEQVHSSSPAWCQVTGLHLNIHTPTTYLPAPAAYICSSRGNRGLWNMYGCSMNETRRGVNGRCLYDCDVIYDWDECEGDEQPQMAWLEHRKHALPKGHDVLNHYDTPHTGGIYKNDTPIMSNKASNRKSFRSVPPSSSETLDTYQRPSRTNERRPSLPPARSTFTLDQKVGEKRRADRKDKVHHTPTFPFPFPFPFAPFYPSTNQFILISIRRSLLQVTKE